MSESASVDIQREGTPAITIRLIGWAVIAALVGFHINNVLVTGFGFSGLWHAFSGEGPAAFVPLLVYVVTFSIAGSYVLRSPDTALRWDSRRLHNFNLYIIRAAFWSVFLVGVIDSSIAILRVEKVLPAMLGDDMARSLGLSRFVGSYIHIPLILASLVIAYFSRTLGFIWLTLLIVFAELLIVITRFVFSYEQALMGDLVRYWYAALFLFASAYTLYDDGHVRVDILYAGFRSQSRGRVNAVGSLVLGVTTCWVILAIGFNGAQSIINAPVMNFEITQTGGVGMFVKYQMAAFLAIFATTMMIQFISFFFESVADFRNEPGHRNAEPVGH